MLSLPLPVRIFLWIQPADMRKSFDGLAQLDREFLGADPLSGHLFVFRSKHGDRLKLLYWDSDGLCLFYKHLGIDTFAYLRDVLARLPTQPADRLPELLPHRWQAARLNPPPPP